MLKILVGILITFIIIVLFLPLAVLTFLGFVPGLSSLVGAGPKDLGIRITKEDSKITRETVGTEIIAMKKGDTKEDFTLEGKKDAELSFDSKEVTALVNNRPWIKYPIKNVQVKIHPDGTVEGSGILIVSRVMPLALALGYSEGQVREVMAKFNIPPFEVPIYVKGKGSVVNDAVNINAQNMQIGVLPIPGEIVSQIEVVVQSVLEDTIQKHSSSVHIESLMFTEGKMNFKGYVPKKQYVLAQ